MYRVKKPLLIILLLTCVFTGGCWNRHEIQVLGFVILAGLDTAREPGTIMLSVHIAKPFAVTGGVQPPVQERPFWLVNETGRTVFEAILKLGNESPRQLVWGHNRFLIIGEELARQGVKDVIDWFFRNGGTRENIHILVVKGARAEDMMQAEFELERIPEQGFHELVDSTRNKASNTFTPTLLELGRDLETEGIEPLATRAELVPRPTKQDIRGHLADTVIPVSARFWGSAAFKDDRLVGWLDDRQTRGVLWVRGKVKGALLNIRHPLQDQGLVSLEVLSSKSEVIPELVDGRPVIRVKIEAEANFGETQNYIELVGSPEIWASLERRMAEAIRNEVKSALNIAQNDLQSDVFGFGWAIYRKHPQEWMDMKENWDEIFPTLEVQIDVRAKLQRSGMILRKVRQK